MTDRYAVIGNPVSHSKSPFIHAEFARQTGEDISYVAIPAADGAFEAAVQRFRDEGGLGMNVTLPFKHRAYALAQTRSRRADEAAAANTLAFREDAIFGDNTDGCGLVRDLTVNLSRTLRGSRILLIGAGGASYGVCGPLLDEAPEVLVVANRTPEKAASLRDHFAKLHVNAGVLSASSFGNLAGQQFDVVVHATSAGLQGEMPALPQHLFARGALGYDMMYGRTTPFVEYARANGAQAADGTGMLVEQAAESFWIWRGIRPQTAPVIAMVRADAP